MAIPYMRLHPDEAGESHMRREELPLVPTDFAPPAPAIEVSATAPAVGWRFLRAPPGWVGDWHPTPRRIWIFCLAGAMEFKSSDGAVNVVEPGSVMLLEDTAGRGHFSRVIGERDVLFVAVQV